MNIKLSNKDYIWSYIGVFFSAFSYIIITPFALRFLDSARYGLWGVFQSLVSITLLFDFGFSTTFARNINYCWSGATELKREGVIFPESKESNFRLLKKTMKACQMVFLVISVVAIILMLTVGTYYIISISGEIRGNEPVIAWLIYAVAIFLNIYYGYYNSFLRGVGAIKDVNKATVIGRTSQIILAVVMLFLGFGLIGTGVAYLSYGVIFRGLGKKYFLEYHGIGANIASIKEKNTFSEIKEMFLVVWHNAFKEGIVTLSNYLANQACTIICSIYLTLTITGIYSLGVQLATAIANVSAALYNANQPVLQNAYISKDTEATKRTMSLIVVSFSVMYIVLTIFVCLIGLPLLNIVKPNNGLTMGLLLACCLYQFVLKFRNCYTSYFSCTNRILYVKAFLISSVGGVFLALVFMGLFQWGVWGLIAAQLISQSVYNAWAWTFKAHKEMELSAKETVIYGIEESKRVIQGFLKKGSKVNG